MEDWSITIFLAIDFLYLFILVLFVVELNFRVVRVEVQVNGFTQRVVLHNLISDSTDPSQNSSYILILFVY